MRADTSAMAYEMSEVASEPATEALTHEVQADEGDYTPFATLPLLDSLRTCD